MKILLTVFFVTVALLLVFSSSSLIAAVPFQLSDPQMDHFLQGPWRGIGSAVIYNGKTWETAHVANDVVYYSNHTFDLVMSYVSSTGTLVTDVKGYWKIVEGKLSVVYTEVTHPQYDNQQFDLMGNGQLWTPFKNTSADTLPPPATLIIRFLDKDRIQGEDGVIFYRVPNI